MFCNLDLFALCVLTLPMQRNVFMIRKSCYLLQSAVPYIGALELQRWEAMKYKYFVTVFYCWFFRYLCCIYLSTKVFIFLATFDFYFYYKYMFFLLLTFSKQAYYFGLNAFDFLATIRTFYQPKMSLFDILGMSLNNFFLHKYLYFYLSKGCVYFCNLWRVLSHCKNAA